MFENVQERSGTERPSGLLPVAQRGLELVLTYGLRLDEKLSKMWRTLWCQIDLQTGEYNKVMYCCNSLYR